MDSKLPGTNYPSRYPTLDAWRGVASLMVLFNHCLSDRQGWAQPLWLGVQLFFVISGYCIAAATDSALRDGRSFASFMKRRVRRIAPPYLASVALILLVAAYAGFLRGGLSGAVNYLSLPPVMILQNLTMTQWLSIPYDLLTGADGLKAAWFNKSLMAQVHWSINYEEQFYLIAGLLLALQTTFRPLFSLFMVTFVSLVLNLAAPGLITGFFVDYWLQFAVGIALYFRLCKLSSVRHAAAVDLGILACLIACAFTAADRGEFSFTLDHYQFFGQLSLCLIFMLVLTWLRPIDARVAKLFPVRVLTVVGGFSYSLYLFHQPLNKLCWITEPQLKLAKHLIWQDGVAFPFILGAVYLLHLAVERPFLNRPASAALSGELVPNRG